MKKALFISVTALLTIMGTSCTNNSNSESSEVAQDSVSVEAQAPEVATADSASVEEVSEEEINKEDETITNFLKAIYTPRGTSEIFEDKWVYKHCTAKMQKKLRDEYDYDGEGWGSWIIGGWDAGEDIDTKLDGVTFDGTYYYAALKPGKDAKNFGYRGKRVIRFTMLLEDGVPVIDDCSRVQNFRVK